MASRQAPDMAEVLRRLEALEDERGILQTYYRYGHSVDYGRVSDWVDCFTEEGAYEIRRRPGIAGQQVVRNEGRAALTKFISAHPHAPQNYLKHLMIEPRIAIKGKEATAQSYFVVVEESDQGPYVRSFGRYLDKMVKCPDGVWRFTERISEVEGSQGRTKAFG